MPVRPLVIAHRGASAEAVENSLTAFRLAHDRGADAVELDVHATADGALVVHHDEMIGPHHVPHCSLAEVRAHLLADGHPAPTLEEALHVIHERHMTAFVEVKSLAPRWDERLLDVIAQSPAPQRVAVHSFDHRIVHRLGLRRPELPRGVLSTSYPVNPLTMMDDADAATLWQIWRQIDEPLVAQVHDEQMLVYAWTVDEPRQMQRLVDLGVDGLCTNHPERARRTVDSISS
jgi:glycerophosphoryl diester phosphodiesterase